MKTQEDYGKVSDFTPGYWFSTWEQSVRGETGMVTRGHSTVEFWDNMSRDYDHNHGDGNSRKRPSEIVVDLERRGYFTAGMRVLDIGCGTGRLALAFAERGGEVTTLDFSAGMIEKLKDNCTESVGRHITPVRGDWIELDLAEMGWEHAFDLVLANMTPAIRSKEGLLKMIAASRGGCYLRTWAAKRRSAILDDIWRMFTNTEPTRRPAPFIFIFNAIFAMGYYPSLDFDPISWDREKAYADMLDQYLSYAKGMFNRPEEELRNKLTTYFESFLVNGNIRDRADGMTGLILWNVNGR